MIDTKKTIRTTTIVFILCILVVTLFALAPVIENRYSSRAFTVTIDTGVGDIYKVIVQEDTPVIKPEEPKKDGYKFVGWYYKGKEYDFTVHIVKDITLKAVWEEEKEVVEEPEEEKEKTHVNVTFDVVGGSLIDDQKVKIGGTASIPNNPTREGYTFVEWQVNGKTFDFGTTLSEDITIVAVWREN